MKLTFVVPGQPVAKQRPKFARMPGFVRTYTPKETVNYESLVRLAAADAMHGADPIEGAVRLLVEIYLKIPVSESKKRQAMMAAGTILPTKKPDGDNVLKAVKDAVNGVVWRDDAQVVDGRYVKRYSLAPCVQVSVEAVSEAVVELRLEQPALPLALLIDLPLPLSPPARAVNPF